jgi:outer membrane protein assembly factor BamB
MSCICADTKTCIASAGKRGMMKTGMLSICPLIVILFCLLATDTAASGPVPEYERYWPQWRGPLATGVAPHGNPPVQWDETTNVRWKIPLPGLGHATPVVWNDRIIVATAVPADKSDTRRGNAVGRLLGALGGGNAHRYDVYAISRNDGHVLWRRTARVEAPHDGRHGDASWASCSPVTDGTHIVVSFGSRGFYCYDMDGNLLWEKDFGDLRIRFSWGEGCSPVLAGDRVIITWDHVGPSFIVVLDIRTGKEIWRADRNDGTSWSTPLVIDNDGKKHVVVNAIRRVRSYDLESGDIVWETRGMTANPIPSPVAADGIVYVMGGFQESILQAISLDKVRGDAAASGAIVWEYGRDTSYVPSPLLYNGLLYFLKSNRNILTCLDAATGEPYYTRQRLDGISGVYASPVAAQGHVYIVGRNGVTVTVKHGPQFEVLARNILDDRFDASPVIVGEDLFLRGHKYLYCIGR